MRTAEDIARQLAPHAAELRAMGVSSLALFGSSVRGEEQEGSDIDLLVDFERPVSLFHFVRVRELLESVLAPYPVDLVMRSAVRKEIREEVLREAVPVA